MNNEKLVREAVENAFGVDASPLSASLNFRE
jgi:hypothetical protein